MQPTNASRLKLLDSASYYNSDKFVIVEALPKLHSVVIN
ncbi:hypothetical protein Cal7507_6048 [Calothrix sp. PCC 7507]|nr:hypothetical protein Cal7507_6048 [Calothrix sp. PCC 7507]